MRRRATGRDADAGAGASGTQPMFGMTGRYVLREVIPPLCLTQVVFTFLMMLDPINKRAEELIGVGVDGSDVVGLLVTLLPYAIGISLPISLLVGVLMALGRLSGDREIVAMQACGISIYRILAPLLLLAVAVAAVDCYVLSTMVPNANQRFREIVFRVSANRAEGEVKPRVFEVDRFPRVVLYVREVAADGWRDVFLADVDRPGQPDVYVAEWGRFAVDSERRTVSVLLRQGQRHRVDPANPGGYEVHDFEQLTIQLDASALFPDGGPVRGVNELSVGELRREIATMREAGISPHQPIMAMHEKFSIPVACLVFVLLAVGLGVSNRREGRLASFAVGIAVILAYYVMMYLGTAMAKGQWLSPHLVRWIPNIVLGLAGIVLVRWRSGTIERRATLPWLAARSRAAETVESDQARDDPQAVVVVSPATGWGVNLLDRYVTRIYFHWMALAFVGLLGLFYVFTFLDLADKLFKEETTLVMLLTYFWYATPQYVSYVLPIAALVATLVSIGLLTRTSELTVMKACGISLYRMAVPILGFSLLWSALLFAIGEGILAQANRRAETLNHEIRTGRAEPFGTADRAWLVNEDGDIYHYLHFDADRKEIGSLSVWEFDGRPWSLTRRTYAAHAAFREVWNGHDVWSRDFAATVGAAPSYEHDAERALPAVAPPEVFASELPEAELMNYRELERHILELRALGFDVVNLVVELHRKASFPFVTFILTLIAVPFAVTIGPRGALYGVGAGIVLGFTYWIVLSVFGALGSAGALMPATAAWAPNLIFGASAGYFLFSVRT